MNWLTLSVLYLSVLHLRLLGMRMWCLSVRGLHRCHMLRRCGLRIAWLLGRGGVLLHSRRRLSLWLRRISLHRLTLGRGLRRCRIGWLSGGCLLYRGLQRSRNRAGRW